MFLAILQVGWVSAVARLGGVNDQTLGGLGVGGVEGYFWLWAIFGHVAVHDNTVLYFRPILSSLLPCNPGTNHLIPN